MNCGGLTATAMHHLVPRAAACKSYPLPGCCSSSNNSNFPSLGVKLLHTSPGPPSPSSGRHHHQQHPAAHGGPGRAQATGGTAARCTKGAKRRSSSSSPELLRCKRRFAFAGLAAAKEEPGGGGGAAVARRNERERNRVKLVNLGFQTLRQHVPNGAAAKKMSKVETLRSAVEYIRALQQLLDQHEHDAAFPDGLLTPPPGRPSAMIPAASGAACASSSGGSSYASASSPSFGRPEGGGSSVPGSPRSAYSSDESGYEGALSPEEQELLDFTSWFGSY